MPDRTARALCPGQDGNPSNQLGYPRRSFPLRRIRWAMRSRQSQRWWRVGIAAAWRVHPAPRRTGGCSKGGGAARTKKTRRSHGLQSRGLWHRDAARPAPHVEAPVERLLRQAALRAPTEGAIHLARLRGREPRHDAVRVEVMRALELPAASASLHLHHADCARWGILALLAGHQRHGRKLRLYDGCGLGHVPADQLPDVQRVLGGLQQIQPSE
mmetsp:Transcript_12536/g.32202  ORF Transcript_12536/g.32202 Transcript_12536/m.32202 type:complete len:214 (+) Transcript_12536:331-972(+)